MEKNKSFVSTDDSLWVKKSTPAQSIELLRQIFGDKVLFDHKIKYTDQMYNYLFTNILNGKLLPGTTLSEQVVSDFFNISRTPTREVFQRLAYEDLIWIFPQKKTVVAPVRRSKILEGMFMRQSLERSNLEDLVTIITLEQLSILEVNLAQQKQSIVQNDYGRFTELDDSFHKSLFQFTQRERMWDYIKPIKVPLDRIRWALVSKIPENIYEAYEDHKNIFNCLQEQNPEKLIKAATHHIKSINRIIDNLASHSSNFLLSD